MVRVTSANNTNRISVTSVTSTQDINIQQQSQSGNVGVNYILRKGDKGEPGRGITSINKTATVSNIDTYTINYTDNTTSDYEIANGIDGQAATITVGTVTTGDAGTDASVTNSGTPNAAIFNFTIPKGDKGDTGTSGAAATISVGTVTTGNAGTSATVVNSGTSAAAVFDFTIPRGDTGSTGATGADGYSPTATVTKSGDTATISITDKNGTTTETVSDGQDGTDGYSPTAVVTKTDDTAVIFITDKNGTTTATVSDGANGTNGTDGQDGFSPVATVTKSGSVATISITDANGTTTETVSDGLVQDVKVDDVSVVSGSTANIDLTGYAKLASANTFESTGNAFRNILQIQSNSSAVYPYLYLHTPGTQHACLRLNNVNGYLESVTGNQSAYNPMYAGYSSDINSVITTVLNYQYDIGSASNYCKLGNGWMFQLGYHSASTSHTITFPKSFTSTNSYIAWAQQRSGTAGTIKVTCDAANKSTFTLSQSGSIIWFAIGW